jgi:hypothetical protein
MSEYDADILVWSEHQAARAMRRRWTDDRGRGGPDEATSTRWAEAHQKVVTERARKTRLG